MSAVRERIEVEHDGSNPLRFRCSSRSRPGIVHQVDLGSWSGNGGCTCEHFEFRLLPRLREWRAAHPAEPRSGGTATRCSHILAARRAFTDNMIARIAAALPQASETNDDRE